MRLNRPAIEYVLVALEVKRPVEIQWSTDLRSATTTGSCRWMPDGRHLIKIRPNRSADEVSRSVLHEAVHASQAEYYDTAAAWSSAYTRAGAPAGYLHNPYEQEARAIEDEFADDFRLAVPA